MNTWQSAVMVLGYGVAIAAIVTCQICINENKLKAYEKVEELKSRNEYLESEVERLENKANTYFRLYSEKMTDTLFDVLKNAQKRLSQTKR